MRRWKQQVHSHELGTGFECSRNGRRARSSPTLSDVVSHSVPVWCWVLGTGRGVVSHAMGHRGGGCVGHLSLGGKNAGEVSLLFPLVSAGMVDRILVSGRIGMCQQDARLRTWA